MLFRLLHRMLWTAGTIPDLLPTPCACSCSAGIFHHQTSGWHNYCCSFRISFRHPSWTARFPSAPAGSSASDRRRRRQLWIGAAACHRHLCWLLLITSPTCCRRRARRLRHTLDRGYAFAAPTSRRREEGANLLYPIFSSRPMYLLNFSLSILLSSMFLASVVL